MSGSAWLFGRRGSGGALAPGGMLGGSQAGGRLRYRLDAADRLALSARLTAPLDKLRAAEAAFGAEWQPLPDLPVRLLAEHKQAIGDAGRSAFSLLAYGGISDRHVVGPVLVDAYAQAGVVGLRSRDLFADGSVRVSVAVNDRLKLGAGTWAAAQPGVSRVDVGPQLSLRLPVERVPVTLAADWRFRVAGNARPGSGPALTLSTDF